MPLFLLAFGVGGILGTTLGGVSADWSVLRSIVISNVAMGLRARRVHRHRRQPVAAWFTVLVVAMVGSMLAVTLQMRLMQVAGDAQTLGAALNHASLNLANALGAWLGGVVIAAGFGYTAPSWVGAGLSVAGLAGRRRCRCCSTAATPGRRVSGCAPRRPRAAGRSAASRPGCRRRSAAPAAPGRPG